jgi:CRISPR-associated protein Csm5
MMPTKTIRHAYRFQIQALTPVHIGCGKNYVQHFDYVQEGNKVHVFDQARLFAQVGSLGESAISAFTAALESQELWGFMKERKIDPKSVSLFSFPWNSRFSLPTDIRRYIRDGLGRPIIPGSSLKGLFRTAILSRLVEEEGGELVAGRLKSIMAPNEKPPNPKFAANPIADTMLGRDAKYNLMRALTVSDCTLPASAVQVDEAFVTRLVSGGRRFNRKSWSMLIERVRPGESAAGQISFDHFLQEQALEKAHFGFRANLSLDWLLVALRRRTEHFLKAELAFLTDKGGEGIQELQGFYTKLQRDIEQLGPKEAIVQFAWGSGWKGMTGELLQPDQLSRDLRSKLRLANKYLDFPFPKSRRLAGKGENVQPIGWVKFTFKEKGENNCPTRKKSNDSSQISLTRIEAVQSWDDLKKVAASDFNSENNRSRSEVVEAFINAALRVKSNYPKTWSSERDQQMIDWLWPAGFTWPQAQQAHRDALPQELSDEEQQRVDRILGLKDWGQFKNARLIIEELSLPETEALKQVFCRPGLELNKNKKNEEKKKAWKALENHLRKIK